MLKKLVLYGTVYPDIIKIIDAINFANPEWEVIGYIDDKSERHGKEYFGYPVLGGREIVPDLAKEDNLYIFNNYYDSLSEFKRRIQLLESYNCKIPNLIHPAVDMNYVKIGKGCLIAGDCTIGSKVEIGDYVTIRIRSIVCHDVTVEDYAFIAPGVTVGSCLTLKTGCFIGTGATILRTKNIGAKSVVGAGAVVVNHVPDGVTVVGVPARKLRKNLIRRTVRRLKREIKNLRQYFQSLSNNPDSSQ